MRLHPTIWRASKFRGGHSLGVRPGGREQFSFLLGSLGCVDAVSERDDCVRQGGGRFEGHVVADAVELHRFNPQLTTWMRVPAVKGPPKLPIASAGAVIGLDAARAFRASPSASIDW